MGKSKLSVAALRLSYFYDLEAPGTFGVPNRILRGTETELFKTHKTENVPGKNREECDPPNYVSKIQNFRILQMAVL